MAKIVTDRSKPRNLPPLEVGTAYQAQDFEGFEFEARKLHRALTGEDRAILRLHLSNATKLDIPAKDEDLLYLLRMLILAHPKETLDFVKTQPWCPAALKGA